MDPLQLESCVREANDVYGICLEIGKERESEAKKSSSLCVAAMIVLGVLKYMQQQYKPSQVCLFRY